MEECNCKPAKSYAERIIEYREFISLVKQMRKAQDAFNISVSADNIEDIDFWHIRMLEFEREVDEYLKKMEE